MGRELGTMFESEIPSFLVKLGKEIAARGLDFESYRTQYRMGLRRLQRNTWLRRTYFELKHR